MLGRVSESLDFKECLLPQDGAELRRDNLQELQEITAKFEEHERRCCNRFDNFNRFGSNHFGVSEPANLG